MSYFARFLLYLSLTHRDSRLWGIFSAGHFQNLNKKRRYSPALITALRETIICGKGDLVDRPFFNIPWIETSKMYNDITFC